MDLARGRPRPGKLEAALTSAQKIELSAGNVQNLTLAPTRMR